MNQRFILSRYVILLSLLLGLVGLSGCFGPDERHAYDSKVLNDQNSAVVVGEIVDGTTFVGNNLIFKNVSTNETITYSQATYFCFRAPEGKYILEQVSGRNNPFRCKENPLTFEVKNGEKVYIGTILVPLKMMLAGTNDTAYNKVKSSMKNVVSRKLFFEYALRFPWNQESDFVGEGVDFYVANNCDELKEEAKKAFPQLKLNEFQVRLLSE